MIAPESEAELAEAVRSANAPLRIQGGGTRGATASGNILSTSALRGIVLYEPGALTLVARAGTPLSEIEAALAAEGQRLAFEPMDHRRLLGTEGAPTIGGMAAANASGPRRIQAGACRDSMIGVRFVDGTGAIVKNGGRVMKNVTGYDLVKLLAGSRGTLGVITEVAFKLLPAPETSATLLAEGLSDTRAVEFLSAALGSPYGVTGAAHLSGARSLVRIEGFAASVAARAKKLCAALKAFGEIAVERDPVRNATLWADIRDAAPFHGRKGDVWRFSVKPSDGPPLAARLGAEAHFYDWGGGLLWALAPEGTDLRTRMGGIPGHATLVRKAPAAPLPTFHPEAPPVAALSAALRRKFDPRGIFESEPAA
jgi:glycolate oxidase FAD binding subunit